MSSSSGKSPPPTDGEAEPEPDDQLFVDVKLSSRSDTGTKGDMITNATKPSFEINTLPNAKIILTIDGVDYEAVADSNGKVIISLTDPLTDGEYVISVTAKDETLE